MAEVQWKIRFPGQGRTFYGPGNRRFFSIKVIHDGMFLKRPNRLYVLPKVNYVDFLDIDRFYLQDFKAIMEQLGHVHDYYAYFHIEEETLDIGLRKLQNRFHIDDFLLKVCQNFGIVHTIYVEHEMPTVFEFYPKTLRTAPVVRISQLLEPYVKEDQSNDVFKARRYLFDRFKVWIEFERVEEALGKSLDQIVGYQSDSNDC